MGKPFSQKQRQAWIEKIQAQQESGLSIQKWCKENAIAPHLFHYWKPQLFPKAIHRSNFIELDDQKDCVIDIGCQGVLIHIESPTLKQAFQALKELGC